MKQPALVAALTCASVTLTGCGSSNSGLAETTPTSIAASSTSAMRPTLTAKNLQPPKQRNENNRLDVVFDPCTYIDDDTIRRAGFDPSTRKRGHDYIAEYAFLDCRFDSKLRHITISSGNVTMEQERQRYAGMIEDLRINGREAIIVREPERVQQRCALNMRTRQGYVWLATSLNDEALIQRLDPCDGIVDIAKVIEPTIGQGN